jgi:hypothetical protein
MPASPVIATANQTANRCTHRCAEHNFFNTTPASLVSLGIGIRPYRRDTALLDGPVVALVTVATRLFSRLVSLRHDHEIRDIRC